MYNYLPQNIKYLRNQKRMKQEELGKILGKSFSTIANYESGYRTPSPEDIRTIANYFHVSIDRLLNQDLAIVFDGDIKADWICEELKRMALSDKEFDMLESYIDYLKSLRNK